MFVFILLLLTAHDALSATSDVTYVGGVVSPTNAVCGDGSVFSSITCLVEPSDVAYYPITDKFYLCDKQANHIRALQGTTFLVTTIMGPVLTTSSGDVVSTTATLTRFNAPSCFALSVTTLYISDTGNRKINALELTDVTLSTFAGDGTDAFLSNQAILSLQFRSPVGMCSYNRRLYVMNAGDSNMHRLHEIIGIGTSLGFGFPGGMSVTIYKGVAYVTRANEHLVYTVGLMVANTNIFIGGTSGDATSTPAVLCDCSILFFVIIIFL